MTENLNLIYILRKCFSDDRICMYYHGNFDDTFTDKLITLANYDVTKKAKRRMSFLMSESFQNIVRHEDKRSGNKMTSLFGIRGIDPYLHIFTSNMVKNDQKVYLENKLKYINKLDKEKIKEHYTKVLNEGKVSNKGGAGLGLIEMAKRSERPIQMDFKKIKTDSFAFNLQVDLPVEYDTPADQLEEPMSIQENTVLYDLILYKQIIFLYKGDFSDEVISPLLSILEQNTDGGTNTAEFKIYHTAVELIQNVSRHGVNLKGKKNGIFSLNKLKDGYYLCTENYIDNDGEAIIKHINKINALGKKDLDTLYRETLKKSARNNDKNAGVGLIDLRRILMNPIEIKSSSDKYGHYLMMGVKISL